MRHGRKKRDLLREWKIATGMKSPSDPTDPETGRPRLLAKYTNRPFLVMTGGTRNDPILEWVEYDEIVRRNMSGSEPWVSPRLTMKFGRNPDLSQRCWLSGVQMYFVAFGVLHDPMLANWAASREHLVCERNGGFGQRDSNIAIVGSFLNKKIGHSPLPLKLLHRRELASREFSRDDPSWETCLAIVRHIIEVENQHRLESGYPWQPWSLEPGTRDHKIATAFQAEMRAAEQEFLALDDTGRRQWLEEFRWRW